MSFTFLLLDVHIVKSNAYVAKSNVGMFFFHTVWDFS
eukprot:CAMPEP_0114511054 /NCGR_PEP_ID=MMETSP0109-20121206/14141_1 /TAXON_ID=29199 /ORGANISM="Chlorarachnion reptans, Strain CCCM449" /LENGTH=36 /DNA_ID= /DNA_START= /DNA_END= /DNA_ORIENTATION=